MSNQNKQGRSLAEKAKIRVDENAAPKEVVTEKNAEEKKDPVPKPEEKKTQTVHVTGKDGIRAEIKVTVWNLYVFLLYHNYISIAGVIGVLLSLFCLGYFSYEVTGAAAEAVTTSAARDYLMLFVGLWFTLINPILLLFKAFSQAKVNPAFASPIIYTFADDGILQKQGSQKGEATWNVITKTVFLRSTWLLYTGRMTATILNVAQLGSDKQAVRALIEEKTGKKNRK